MQPLVRRTRLGWLAAAVLALVVSTVAVGVPSAGAADRCDGVWVVVDARALGGELTTRCAPGDPASGLEALELAGHDYGFVPRQPGLVCTIDARPDPCNGAPADAYWGYFHAPAGGEWEYSTLGAGNRDPEPGSVEGWAFGDDARPGRRPPSNAEPEPEPEPTPEPSTAPATAAPEPSADPAASDEERPSVASSEDASSGDAVAPSPSAELAESTEPTPGDEPEPAAGTVAPTPDGRASAEGSATTPDDPEPTGESTVAPLAEGAPDEGGSSPTPLIVFGLLFLAIAGAAVVRSRRREA